MSWRRNSVDDPQLLVKFGKITIREKMVSRRESQFPYFLVPSSSSSGSKENWQPVASNNATETKTNFTRHKPLGRRATCPNVNFSQQNVLNNSQKENQPQNSATEETTINSVFRKPLSTLQALNRNLHRIFHKAPNFVEIEEKEEKQAKSFLNESSGVINSSLLEPLIDFDSIKRQNLEKLLFGHPYLQESMEYQLRGASQTLQKISWLQHNKNFKAARSAIIDWLFAMQNYFSLPDIATHIAIQILDRSMTVLQIQEKDLQLAGGAAFWIATKMEGVDTSRNKITGRHIRHFIGRMCSLDQLKRAEFRLFKKLGFCIPRDSALSAFYYQLHILKPHLSVDSDFELIGQFALDAGLMCWSLTFSGLPKLVSTATISACLLYGVQIDGRVWNEAVQRHEIFVPKEIAEQSSFEVMRVLLDVQGPRKLYPNLRAKYVSTGKNNAALHPKMSHENIIYILRTLWGIKG